MAVVIETTIGDFTIDLFTEERPQTCKNFLKLCKIKYYNFCLFHSIQPNFLAQTGDPSGIGTGGESVFGIVYGENARYYEGEKMPKIKHTKPGLLSMVNCGNNMLGSQFFVTLGSELQSLDEHCVFAEIAEGMDILLKLNETICDTQHRPYQDIRITHTVILHDPFEDLSGLVIPDASPVQSQQALDNGRIGADEEIDDTAGLTAIQVEEMKKEREAKARATILEIVGDLPDAEMAPPENVLFVCKLNPVTNDDDLEIIFSRFGKVKSCEVIRDQETGDSLQYAFVEFEDKKACEEAFFKMDNVLIDDRRIHVDFSQSVAKMRWRGKGRGVDYFDKGNRKANDRQPRKDDSRRDSKPDSRGESKSDSRKESKPDSRKESKPDSRKESKPDSRKESKPDSRKESKPDSRHSDSRKKDEKDVRRENSSDSSRPSKKDFEGKTMDDTRRKEMDKREDISRNCKDSRDETRNRGVDGSCREERSDMRMEGDNWDKRQNMRMEGNKRKERSDMRIDGNIRNERRHMRMDENSVDDRRDFRMGGNSRDERREARMEGNSRDERRDFRMDGGNIRNRLFQQNDDDRRERRVDDWHNHSHSAKDPVTGKEWGEPFRVVERKQFYTGKVWEEPFGAVDSRRSFQQRREFDAGIHRIKDRYDGGVQMRSNEHLKHNSGPSDRFRSEERAEWKHERRVEKLEVEHSRNGLERNGNQSSREIRPRGSSSSHTASPISASRSKKERYRDDEASPFAESSTQNSSVAIEQIVSPATEGAAKTKDKKAKKRKTEEDKPVKLKKKKKYSSSSNSDSSASSDSSNSDSSSSDSDSTSRKRKGKVRTTIAKKYYHKGKLVKIVKKKKDTSTDSDSDDSSESDSKKKKHKKKGRAKKIIKIIEKKKKRKHDSSDDSDSESSSSSSSSSSSEESDSDSGSQNKKRKTDAKKKLKKKIEKKKKKNKQDSDEENN